MPNLSERDAKIVGDINNARQMARIIQGDAVVAHEGITTIAYSESRLNAIGRIAADAISLEALLAKCVKTLTGDAS
jgi:hypothetical protein